MSSLGSARTVVVPSERLPAGPSERRIALDGYFRDLLATEDRGPEGWRLTLRRPRSTDYYIDDRLDGGLAWWGNLTVDEIPFARRTQDGILLTLNDCWSLSGWSGWLRSVGDQEQQITILHIDDHTDLMTPLLGATGGGWEDLLTGSSVRTDDPPSIERAIESGAIGIGSFVVPFLHAVHQVEIRHLVPPGRYAALTAGLRRTSERDTLLKPGSLRPAVEWSAPGDRGTPDSGVDYFRTDDVGEWLKGLADGPILLHFDMDFFSNRFNGDSDWRKNPARHDPPPESVYEKVAAVAQAIRGSPAYERVVDVTVALSPGFFPSELWPSAIETLHQNLGRR